MHCCSCLSCMASTWGCPGTALALPWPCPGPALPLVLGLLVLHTTVLMQVLGNSCRLDESLCQGSAAGAVPPHVTPWGAPSWAPAALAGTPWCGTLGLEQQPGVPGPGQRVLLGLPLWVGSALAWSPFTVCQGLCQGCAGLCQGCPELCWVPTVSASPARQNFLGFQMR